MKFHFTVCLAALVGTTSLAREEIIIGATISETGLASTLGDPEAKTLKMLVEEINVTGGVKGKKIKLVMYDDGTDPLKARSFATRLIEDDKVVAIIGGTTTGTSMAVIPVAEKGKVPFISLAGGIEIIDPVKLYTFKTPHTDKMACLKVYEDAKKRNITRIGLISGSDDFGASMRAQCIATAKNWGIEIVADESYGPTDTDMTAQLTKIRAVPRLQAVLNPGFGPGSAITTRNFHQLGFMVPLYQSAGVASNAFIELAGAKAAEGVRLPGAALLVADQLPANDQQKNIVMAYKTTFEKTTNSPVGTFGGFAHDALRIVVNAIERAHSTKPGAIRDAIENTKDFVGVTGIYNFSQTDHLGLDLSAFRMLEVKNGGWVVVP